MRIGGAFQFGQGNVPVGLAGGEVFYAPPGNFYCNLGNVTLLQVFDGINNIWRNIGYPGGNVQVVSCDGSNYRLVNMSGNIAAVNITNAGSGATVNGIGAAVNGVTIGFGAAPANGIVAQAYAIVGGKLSGLTIAAGGSGFVFPPVLVIDPPPLGGIQATATAPFPAAPSTQSHCKTPAPATPRRHFATSSRNTCCRHRPARRSRRSRPPISLRPAISRHCRARCRHSRHFFPACNGRQWSAVPRLPSTARPDPAP